MVMLPNNPPFFDESNRCEERNLTDFSFAISFCRFNSICQSICMFLNDNSQMGMHTHTHKRTYIYNYTCMYVCIYIYIYTYKHITHIHTYVRTYILCIHPVLCVKLACPAPQLGQQPGSPARAARAAIPWHLREVTWHQAAYSSSWTLGGAGI